MPDASRDIERLIVRQLDGELSEEEQLELNRELIRDPAARQLLEDYQGIDGLAGEALNWALADRALGFEPGTVVRAPQAARRRGGARGWWLLAGAVAAALLALVTPHPVLRPTGESLKPMVDRAPMASVPCVQNPSPAGNGQVPMRTVGAPLPRVRRDTGREIFGIVGENGGIYWIEVDRTRTIRRPAEQTTRQWTSGGL